MNWSKFFAMGGYALYVWGVYAVAAIILVVNVVLAMRRRRSVIERLRDFYRFKGTDS